MEVNLTHPVFVCNVSPSGVGTVGESRGGGAKVTEIKRPAINPTNVQKRDIIINKYH